MLNFTNLVESYLIEGAVAGAPNWLNDIIKQHDNLFKTNISENDLQTAFNKSGPGYVAQQEIPNIQSFIRVIAVLNNLYKNSKTNKPSDLTTFYNTFGDINDPKATQNILTDTIKKFNDKSDWTIAKFDSDLADIYDKWLGVADQQAKVALQTYNNDYILPATQKIITKRTSFFDRIARLKSPTQPFTNLIVDVFKYPEEYISGTRKVTQDFPDIVDNLYITNLFNVGLAAKNFFAAEITRLKVENNTNNTQNNPPPQQQTNQQQRQLNQQQTTAGRNAPRVSPPGSRGPRPTPTPSGAPPVPGQIQTAGLNLFDTYLNSVLIQEGPVGQAVQFLRNVGGATKAASLSPIKQFPEVFKRVFKDNANLMNFVTGRPVQYKRIDANGKEISGPNGTGTTDPENYIIGNISKMETTEAVELIKALRSIAEYTRKGIGAGERLKYGQQALGALAGAAIGPGGSGPGGIYQGPG
jgi:hypothetical protein